MLVFSQHLAASGVTVLSVERCQDLQPGKEGHRLLCKGHRVALRVGGVLFTVKRVELVNRPGSYYRAKVTHSQLQGGDPFVEGDIVTYHTYNGHQFLAAVVVLVKQFHRVQVCRVSRS